MIRHNGKELENQHIGDIQINRVLYGTRLVWENNRIIVLGTDDEFDVSEVYGKYDELTADNFFFLTQSPTEISGSASAYVDETGHLTYLTIVTGIEKSYNASTGALTFYQYDSFNANSTVSPSVVTRKKADMRVVLVSKPEKLNYLGLGMTFDVKNLFPNDYQNFTVDNFIARNWDYKNGGQRGYLLHGARNEAGSWSGTGKTTLVKNYDSSTGILNFYYNNEFTTDLGESGNFISKLYVYLVKRSIQ